MVAPIVGKTKYYSGDDGTVTLGASEILTGLWCVASGTGAYLTIAGGNQIALVSGVPFALGPQSFTAEWVGVDIVFSNTVSYFVQVAGPFE